MPFHSRSTLEAWLEEFKGFDYPLSDGVRVIEQYDDDGDDSGASHDGGLIGLRLRGALTGTYLQPVEPGSHRWRVTFESREDPISLDSAGVARLGAELTTIAALCAFLESKSHETGDAPVDVVPEVVADPV